jgi:hypothetical protein
VSELAGPDTVDATHDGFYSRLQAPPHPQVAGAKNQYYFLSAFFIITWESERPRGVAHDNLYPLFADRVRRSAEQGLALVTLHGML